MLLEFCMKSNMSSIIHVPETIFIDQQDVIVIDRAAFSCERIVLLKSSWVFTILELKCCYNMLSTRF